MLYDDIDYKYEYRVTIVQMRCGACGRTSEFQENDYLYNKEGGKSADNTAIWLTCPFCYRYHKNWSAPVIMRNEWLVGSKVHNLWRHNGLWRIRDTKGTPSVYDDETIAEGDYHVTDIDYTTTVTPYINTGTGSVLIGSAGETVVIQVLTNGDHWEISPGSAWCAISPTYGRGNSTVTLSVGSSSVARSTSFSIRSYDSQGAQVSSCNYTVS